MAHQNIRHRIRQADVQLSDQASGPPHHPPQALFAGAAVDLFEQVGYGHHLVGAAEPRLKAQPLEAGQGLQQLRLLVQIHRLAQIVDQQGRVRLTLEGKLLGVAQDARFRRIEAQVVVARLGVLEGGLAELEIMEKVDPLGASG